VEQPLEMWPMGMEEEAEAAEEVFMQLLLILLQLMISQWVEAERQDLLEHLVWVVE